MQFDMGRAWEEGLARVRANLSLLAILGGVFFFLPAVILYLAMPQLMTVGMMPGAGSEQSMRALESQALSFVPLFLGVMLASFVGYCAMIALIGDSRRLSVGEAIAVGFKALLPLVGVMVLFALGYFLFALLAGLIFGLLVAGLSAISTGLAYGVAVLLGAAIVIAVFLLLTRVSLTLPVIAIERVANPVKALRRSWQMTRLVQWRLLGFYALFFIAYMVVALVLFMIMGLLAAAVGSPAVLGFLNGLAGMAVAVVLSGLLAAIYRQLAGEGPEGLGQTFD